MICDLWKVALQDTGEAGIKESCNLHLASVKLAGIKRSPLTVTAKDQIGDLGMEVKMRLLIAIREVKISRRYDFSWMAVAPLCPGAVGKKTTLFDVLKGKTAGLHHRLLKFHLLITGESGVEQ